MPFSWISRKLKSFWGLIGLLVMIGSWLVGAAWLPISKERATLPLWNARLSSLAQTPEEEVLFSQMDQALSGMQLRITVPKRLRLGEEGQLRLEVLPAPQGMLANRALEERLILEARPELPGIQVKPVGVWSEVLNLQTPLHFLWSAVAHRRGIYRGTLWVYLRADGGGGGSGIAYPLLAYALEIRVDSVLGFSQSVAGGLGLALWGLATALVIWRPRNFVNNRTN